MRQSSRVSIITPAFNAEACLERTLDSLRAQTFPFWEAIVVDDGSTDGTLAVAEEYARRDGRFRVTHQSNAGVSAARNAGLRLARADWILFLDADDTIAPTHLERLTSMLAADPTLDAVYCGWDRLHPDGSIIELDYGRATGDLFERFAWECLFAVHCCVFRKALLEKTGDFDTSLTIAEDWDLWLRIARTGANFGLVDVPLAHYVMRPESASDNGVELLRGALRVHARGHTADPRVRDPDPRHADGLSTSRAEPGLYALAWAAGLTLAAEGDVDPLFELVEDLEAPGLNACTVAHSMTDAMLLPGCNKPHDWFDLCERLREPIDDFLLQLEKQSRASGLTRRAWNRIEDRVVRDAPQRLPFAVGSTHAAGVEITEPIEDLRLPDGAERLQLFATVNGHPLGRILLPVCDGCVPAYVLRDAIAFEFYWPILGRFLHRAVYPELEIERRPGSFSVRRGDVVLTDHVADDGQPLYRQLHEAVGWLVCLQEIWGRPDLDHSGFYAAGERKESERVRESDRTCNVVEISDEPASLLSGASPVTVVPALGGAALGAMQMAAPGGRIDSGTLRIEITTRTGKELARVAVREALVGTSWDTPATLRERLRDRATRAGERSSLERHDVHLVSSPPAEDIRGSLPPGEHALALGRRAVASLGGSACRRAALPSSAILHLMRSAHAAGDAVVPYHQNGARPRRVVYAPDLISNRLLEARRAAPAARAPEDGARRSIRKLATWIRKNPRERAEAWTDLLPILMYHRVAPTGSPDMARYRVHPEAFDRQLRYLGEAGFHAVGLEEWRQAIEGKSPLPGRAVAITFDDGYTDFAEHAWPLLKRHGFNATLFVVAGEIGKTNRWDAAYGEKLDLLDLDSLRRLRDEGLELGSHSFSHPRLSGLPADQVVREAAESRATLIRELGGPFTSFAYPCGDHDDVVRHLVGACGYTTAVTCIDAKSRFDDSPLELPRLEVVGTEPLDRFVEKLMRRW